jgi:hypothetical protein
MAGESSLQVYHIRPSIMIFADTEPSSTASGTQWNLGASYIYLSDDNREAVQVQYERIEFKERMINGTMRSYHVADKRTFSTSWSDFPSRKAPATTSITTGLTTNITSDSFGAGQDILNWYNSHKKDFWMLLVYDAPIQTTSSSSISPLSGWAEKVHVFFNDFNFTVKKRGPLNDLWDINITLVEA